MSKDVAAQLKNGRAISVDVLVSSPSMNAELAPSVADQAAMPQSITLATHAAAAGSNRTR
jgi:hypothetical protein